MLSAQTVYKVIVKTCICTWAVSKSIFQSNFTAGSHWILIFLYLLKKPVLCSLKDSISNKFGYCSQLVKTCSLIDVTVSSMITIDQCFNYSTMRIQDKSAKDK